MKNEDKQMTLLNKINDFVIEFQKIIKYDFQL